MILIYLCVCLSSPYSFSTIESNRQRVAHHRAHRTVVWKSIEASDGAGEEPKIFPASSTATTQPSDTTRARCVATKSKRESAIKVRIVSVGHRGHRSRRRHRG